MMNLTNSKKATVVKIDNKAYSSFNAYVRPKRVDSEYRRHPNVRVINLDPTDDPEKVCAAYRDIRIKAQLKRIAKNEKRLTENRRIAQQVAADAKIRAEQAARKRAAKKEAYRLNSAVTKRRNASFMRMKDGGFLVAPESVKLRNAAILDAAIIRQEYKVNLVSITSVSVDYEDTGAPLSLWGIDNFKRPPKRFYSANPITRRTELKRVILDILNQGYVVQMQDINAAITSIKGAISALRKEGFLICTVRNPAMGVQTRGWIIPSALNGLTKGAFFTMADVQSA